MPEETEVYVTLTFEQAFELKDEVCVDIWGGLYSDQPNAFEAREYFINRICQKLPEDEPI